MTLLPNQLKLIYAKAKPWLAAIEAHPNLKFFLISAMIIVVVFADVVFKKASISMLDQLNVPGLYRDVKTLYKEKGGLQPYEGFYDIGGAAQQSEPAIQFMKHVIYHLQSPYWDPYSGAGAFGPETMVDIKFSPLTLVIATLGGSNAIFHFITLLAYTLSLFFLIKTLVELLGFSLKTAVVTSIVFLLNGYFTANISSNVSQTLIYLPFALFCVLNFSRRPSFQSYILLVLGYVLPLLVTFFPTTILMVSSVCIYAAGATFQFYKTRKARFRMLLIQATAPLFALGILAFLYLPLFEALKFVGGMDKYGERNFYASNIFSILSFFSPKHFFESYNAIDPKFLTFMGNAIFHFGVISGVLAISSLFSTRWLKEGLRFGAIGLLLFSLSRIFHAPLISEIVDRLPFYRNIGAQYWWMMVACSFPLVFAYSFEELDRAVPKLKVVMAGIVALVILADIVYIGKVYGFPSAEIVQYIRRGRSIAYVFFAIALTAWAWGSIWILRRFPSKRTLITNLLAAAIVVEMIFYFNTARFRREDIFRHPPSYIQFLKQNIGLQRVASYGGAGLPPDLGSAYQIQQLESMTMNILRSYYDFCQRSLTSEHSWWGKDVFCTNRDSAAAPNASEFALNMMSVRYMVVSKALPQYLKLFDERHDPRVFDFETLVIFENPNAFPRVFAVPSIYESPLTPETKGADGRLVVFTEDKKLLDDARAVGISSNRPELKGPKELPVASQVASLSLFKSARITDYGNARVVIEANLDKPGVLALMDNWHPNWSARVDNQDAYVGKINESFRGIALGAGHHQIVMTYRPASLNLALAISFVTALALAMLGIFRVRLNRFFIK